MISALEIEGPFWFGGRDEEVFFQRLEAIPEVKSVDGELIWLKIQLQMPLSCSSKAELLSLLRRYRVPLDPLLDVFESDWTSACTSEGKCSCRYRLEQAIGKQSARSEDEIEQLAHYLAIRQGKGT